MDAIITEIPLISLTVAQTQTPPTFLLVMRQLPLIAHPLLLKLSEVAVIERSIQFVWFFIVNLSFSMELILEPFAFICDFARRVKQLSILGVVLTVGGAKRIEQ